MDENDRITKDLAWINEHKGILEGYALNGLKALGRGAMLINHIDQPGPTIEYLSAGQIPHIAKEARKMVSEYPPDQQFVVIILRGDDAVASYQIGSMLVQ